MKTDTPEDRKAAAIQSAAVASHEALVAVMMWWANAPDAGAMPDAIVDKAMQAMADAVPA